MQITNPQIDDILGLFSTTETGIREWDLSRGEVMFINQTLTLKPGECKAKISEYLASSNPANREALAIALAAGKGSVEYCREMPGGEKQWLREQFVSRGGKVFSRVEDITAIQAARESVRAEKKRFQNLVNAMHGFMFVFDADFNFRDVILPDHMSLLHPREELLKMNGRNIFSPEVSDLYVANIADSLATGKVNEIEYWLDMGNVRYHFNGRLVPNDGLVYVQIRDISDRVRRMEELVAARNKAEQADTMKSAFISNMSHEIRTPLNAIIGFTEVMADEDDSALRKEYLEIVHTNNDMLMRLIGDVLDLSRIESGKVEMAYAMTDAATLMSEVGQANQLSMRPGVELHIVPPDAQVWLYTDAKRVKQVYSTL